MPGGRWFYSSAKPKCINCLLKKYLVTAFYFCTAVQQKHPADPDRFRQMPADGGAAAATSAPVKARGPARWALLARRLTGDELPCPSVSRPWSSWRVSGEGSPSSVTLWGCQRCQRAFFCGRLRRPADHPVFTARTTGIYRHLGVERV